MHKKSKGEYILKSDCKLLTWGETIMALIITWQLDHVRKKIERQTGRLEGKEGGRGRKEEKKRKIVLMLHGQENRKSSYIIKANYF